MNALLLIATQTPLWVFGLFFVLLFSGVVQLRERTVSLRRVLLTPGVFVAWGLVSLFQSAGASPFILPAWALAAAPMLAVAVATARFPGLAADRSEGRVHLLGSWLPLARGMTIFVAKYALGAAIAMHPEARAQLMIWDMAVSGATFGYFVGWTIRFMLSYRRAGCIALAAATSP